MALLRARKGSEDDDTAVIFLNLSQFVWLELKTFAISFFLWVWRKWGEEREISSSFLPVTESLNNVFSVLQFFMILFCLTAFSVCNIRLFLAVSSLHVLLDWGKLKMAKTTFNLLLCSPPAQMASTTARTNPKIIKSIHHNYETKPQHGCNVVSLVLLQAVVVMIRTILLVFDYTHHDYFGMSKFRVCKFELK